VCLSGDFVGYLVEGALRFRRQPGSRLPRSAEAGVSELRLDPTAGLLDQVDRRVDLPPGVIHRLVHSWGYLEHPFDKGCG